MSLKTVTQTTSKTTAVKTNSYSTLVNTVALTDAAGGEFSFTINCNKMYPDAYPQVTPLYAGAGTPYVFIVSKTDGSFVVKVKNIHASAAFNAALGILVKIQPN